MTGQNWFHAPKILLSLLLSLCLFTAPLSQGRANPTGSGANGSDPTSADRKTVTDLDFLGAVSFDSGLMVDDTPVGGLTGLTYDSTHGVFYALSNARFYTLTINLSDGSLNDGDIAFTRVTPLRHDAGPALSETEPGGMALTDRGTLFICSEGDSRADRRISPVVAEFGVDGQQTSTLPVPDKFKPQYDVDGTTQTLGVRPDLGLSSLTITPNGRFLYTAAENALVQDGPAASLEDESLGRIIEYNLATGQPAREFVYTADTVADEPDPVGAFSTNGLVELLAIDNNGTFLALERSVSVGRGYSIKLYQVLSQGALDVSREDNLIREQPLEDDDEIIPPGPFVIDLPVAKTLLLDFNDLGLPLDNIEGMAFGPPLADGRQSLILVSNNMFNPNQSTQVLAFAVDLDTIPAALPTLETPTFIQEDDLPLPEGARLGDADDPAIWVHPTNASQSLVIGTLKEAGLVVFDLNGDVLQTILPGEFGDVEYNNVDLIYGFPLGGQRVDLAVVSNRESDTLVIFSIDPATRQLTDVTSEGILETIFGEDDGDHAAYGLGTYTSPLSGKSYAFVSQGAGARVAQLELADDGHGHVTATLVRMLDLPILTGDPEDSQSEGIVADSELGHLYIAMENVGGILKFSAEPDGGNAFTLIHSFDSGFFKPEAEGLAIYYGPHGTGYLLISSQGDSTFAVFRREGNNEYLGSFVVGDVLDIDQANETDGLDVINVPLGDRFPFGLLVVQDGFNDPQFAAQDDEELENWSTNFKFVSWADVAARLGLIVDTGSFNPRSSFSSQRR